MAAVWFLVKGPATPDGLPFFDESTTTVPEGDDPGNDGNGDEVTDPSIAGDDGSDSTTTTTSGDPTSTTSSTGDVPAATTTTTSAGGASTTTTVASTTEDDSPVGTVSESVPSSSTPTTGPPATVQATTTTVPTTTTEPTTTTIVPTTETPTTSGPAGLQLVFAEEFDNFDSSIWTAEHSTYGDGNNELQCYTTEQVTVSNGSLVLKAEARTETCPNGSTRDVTSGMVRSRGVEFAPGQTIEFRVKLTPNDEVNQGGLWPAFWSSGWAGSWPTGGEWDGLEVMTAPDPKRSVYSIHYANSAGEHAKTSKEIVQAENFSANWHVIRFDYGANGVLTWYLDGTVVSIVDSADTVQGYPAPFDQAMTELKINLALGGNPGPLDSLALPATFEVDYVRIYS